MPGTRNATARTQPDTFRVTDAQQLHEYEITPQQAQIFGIFKDMIDIASPGEDPVTKLGYENLMW
jgi:hypothetical protein